VVGHDESLGTLLCKGGKCPLVLLLIEWLFKRRANDRAAKRQASCDPLQ
jgi:hypothetical protein